MNSDNRALGMLRTALGEILKYFDDKEIVEIYLNSDKYLWIEKLGTGRIRTELYISDEVSRRIIEQVATFRKTIANEKQPIISAELPFYGYRFEGSLPPVTNYPSFNIRKPAIKVIPLEQYVEDKIMTSEQRNMVIAAVKNKKNILLVGGTGSGKTTAANAILNEIAKTGDRLLILEDTRELQCTAEDCESFRTQDNVSMTDLVKSAMRRRPDRIVVGEVRDKSALDLLKAWNTGHPGGICTIHANSAADGLLRLEQLIQEAIPNPQQRLIGEAIDLIIYISRTVDNENGKQKAGRKIKEMCWCNGFKNGNYELKYIE